jgi:hypothetical protein
MQQVFSSFHEEMEARQLTEQRTKREGTDRYLYSTFFFQKYSLKGPKREIFVAGILHKSNLYA